MAKTKSTNAQCAKKKRVRQLWQNITRQFQLGMRTRAHVVYVRGCELSQFDLSGSDIHWRTIFVMIIIPIIIKYCNVCILGFDIGNTYVCVRRPSTKNGYAVRFWESGLVSIELRWRIWWLKFYCRYYHVCIMKRDSVNRTKIRVDIRVGVSFIQGFALYYSSGHNLRCLM